MVKQIAAQFPGAEPDGNGGYRVDCAFQRQQGTVDFEFLSTTGPVVINVAYSDFIWNNGGRCFLGASYSSDVGIWILGDSFLRGAYGELIPSSSIPLLPVSSRIPAFWAIYMVITILLEALCYLASTNSYCT